jgi:alpha-beta hydrolase superfamily lysophospholipase
MSRHLVRKKGVASRPQFLTLQPPFKGSVPVEIRYLVTEESVSAMRPLIVFFAGFGEQSEEALQDASRPFTQRGFSTIAVAIPFHKMSPDVATWLIRDGLRDFLKYIVPSRPFILTGTSRGAAIAASSTKFMSNCTGLIMILPLGLSSLTTKEYIRRAFWDYLVNLSFLDKAARKTARAVAREALHHRKNPGGLAEAFRLAMEQTNNVTDSLKVFDISAKQFAVFVGKKDRIFTLRECSEALTRLLGEAGKKVIIPIEGGHSTVGSKLGQAQLRHVAMWLADQYKNH